MILSSIVISPFVYLAWLIGHRSALFSNVHVGMSRKQVTTLIGHPLRTGSDDRGQRWDYFPDISVWFDTNGVVVDAKSK